MLRQASINLVKGGVLTWGQAVTFRSSHLCYFLAQRHMMRPRLYHIDYKVEHSTLDWLRPEDGTPSVSSLVLPRWDEDFHANVLCVGRESLKGQCFDYSHQNLWRSNLHPEDPSESHTVSVNAEHHASCTEFQEKSYFPGITFCFPTSSWCFFILCKYESLSLTRDSLQQKKTSGQTCHVAVQ